MKKILIIRYSSIGDIIQCMSVLQGLRHSFPDAQIHWLARKDVSQMLKTHPYIHKVWEFDKKEGFSGLIKFLFRLRKEKFTHVYDAHSNIRSMITRSVLIPVPWRWFSKVKYVRRKKDRCKRILQFDFRIRAITFPYRAALTFQKPLEKAWNVNFDQEKDIAYRFPEELRKKMDREVFAPFKGKKTVTLVPSAAWELKRWPVMHWQTLVKKMPGYRFILIGGPTDTFINDIYKANPEICINMAGKTSLMESFYIVNQSRMVISADTGFLHAADLFGIPSLALMGPSALGHPSGKSVKTLEIELPCRPCSKLGEGRCRIEETKKCLVDVTPDWVAREVKRYFEKDESRN